MNTFKKELVAMDLAVVGYVIYIALSVALTLWVARKLSQNGQVYLADVFRNERVGAALNQLLVVGFYLVNFGFVALWLSTDAQVSTVRDVLQVLSVKMGTVLLVVGGLHLVNLLIFSRVRRNGLIQEALRQPVNVAK
ncbi:MAG TPA: hypothetical protein VG317_02285 [Pseudonocardiaceae bacterium]|nr:hypothetical protein [Pseudonocardiaceae bacterium]